MPLRKTFMAKPVLSREVLNPVVKASKVAIPEQEVLKTEANQQEPKMFPMRKCKT